MEGLDLRFKDRARERERRTIEIEIEIGMGIEIEGRRDSQTLKLTGAHNSQS